MFAPTWPENLTVFIAIILCSNTRTSVAHLVKAFDQQSEDPDSKPGWISTTFSQNCHLAIVAYVRIVSVIALKSVSK